MSQPSLLSPFFARISVSALVALAAAWLPGAHAADLVLECNVKAEEKSRQPSHFTQRINVVMEPRYFERYRDDGTRFRRESDGFPVFISRAMIVFQEEAAVKETYDRNTGDYFYENQATGRQVTGHCDKVIDRTQDTADGGAR